jgi:hypothetical protein
MKEQSIPTDAQVKAWARKIVQDVKAGNQAAKRRLRAHLRMLGHRGGIGPLKFPE